MKKSNTSAKKELDNLKQETVGKVNKIVVPPLSEKELKALEDEWKNLDNLFPDKKKKK
jgi:hypothetical protein